MSSDADLVRYVVERWGMTEANAVEMLRLLRSDEPLDLSSIQMQRLLESPESPADELEQYRCLGGLDGAQAALQGV